MEDLLRAARWSGPDVALKATLQLRDTSTLDGRDVERDELRVVYGDLTTGTLEIDGGLVVVLGSLHATAVAMQFGGSGMGELWVAGDAHVGVIDSDESICVGGALHAQVIWCRHNDGLLYVAGRLEADVLIADDQCVIATEEKISACWESERNRFELDAIRARLIPDALNTTERPSLSWRRTVAKGQSLLRNVAVR